MKSRLARLRDVEVPIRVSAVQSIAAIMQSPSDLQTLRVLLPSWNLEGKTSLEVIPKPARKIKQ